MKTKLYAVLVISMFTLLSLGGDETSSSIPSNLNQRYMMVAPQVGNGPVQQIYVIDTMTGRVWKEDVFNNVKGLYFMPIPYASADSRTVSATPPQSTTLESLTLQNAFEAKVDKAHEKEQPK